MSRSVPEILAAEWLSGSSLAGDVDLLVHDCQYTDAEYPAHMGWGQSSLTHALQFARRVAARKTLLFHHDPGHTDDELDAMLEEARTRLTAGGGQEERGLHGCGGHACDRRDERPGDQVVIRRRLRRGLYPRASEPLPPRRAHARSGQPAGVRRRRRFACANRAKQHSAA